MLARNHERLCPASYLQPGTCLLFSSRPKGACWSLTAARAGRSHTTKMNYGRRPLLRAIAGCFLAAAIAMAAAAATPAYKVLRRVNLGGEGGWDYLTVDAAARRLYIARSNRVMVVDA